MKLLNYIEFCRHLKLNGKGNIAGLDFGAKQIGIAISDQSRHFVHPIGSITRSRCGANLNSGVEILSKLGTLFKEKGYHDVTGLVIGLPLLDGRMTPFCHEIRATVGQMEKLVELSHTVEHDDRDVANTGEHDWPSLASGSVHRDVPTVPTGLLEYVPPVCTFWDEYNSTSEAKAAISRVTSKRAVRMREKDSVAACIILDRFLEHPAVGRLGIRPPPPGSARTSRASTRTRTTKTITRTGTGSASGPGRRW